MIYTINYFMIGGSNESKNVITRDYIYSHKLSSNYENELDSFKIFDNSDKEYSPVTNGVKKSVDLSKLGNAHILIQGLLPAPNLNIKKYDLNKVFYMPNNFTPHKHGNAQHHMALDKFKIKKVFSVKKSEFDIISSKEEQISLSFYRNKLKEFNNGESNTAIETWIHWKIPTDELPYPVLYCKKNSIIWWDMNTHHDLNFVSEESYIKNKKGDGIELDGYSANDLKIIITIMDEPGTYYFLCSMGNHAERGHKIKIIVVA